MRGVVVAFIVLMAPVALGGGCVDDDVFDGFEAGEELPGGETTNTLLLGSNAFSRAAENISDEHELLFFSGNSFFNHMNTTRIHAVCLCHMRGVDKIWSASHASVHTLIILVPTHTMLGM